MNIYRVTDTFPVLEFLLCVFAAYLVDQNLAPQNIKSHLAAIRNTLGLPDPREQSSPPILKWVQAGISRSSLQGFGSRLQPPYFAASNSSWKGVPIGTAVCSGLYAAQPILVSYVWASSCPCQPRVSTRGYTL